MVEDRSNSDLSWDHNHYISPVCSKPYTRAKLFQEYTWSEKEGRHLSRGYWGVVSKKKTLFIYFPPFFFFIYFTIFQRNYMHPLTVCPSMVEGLELWQGCQWPRQPLSVWWVSFCFLFHLFFFLFFVFSKQFN